MAFGMIQVSVLLPEYEHETTLSQVKPVTQAPVGDVNGPQQIKSMSSGTGGSLLEVPVMDIVIFPEDSACMKYHAGLGAELRHAQLTGQEPEQPGST